MKRLLLVAAAVVVLAAGCGSSDNISYDPGLSPEEELQLEEIAEEPTETPTPEETPAAAEPTPTPLMTPTPTPDPWDVKTLGAKAEGENVVRMLLVNRTGLKIHDFCIKDSSMADFGPDVMAEGDIFENEETRAVYYDATNAVKAQENAASGQAAGENQTPLVPSYDFKLTFEDQSVMILHSVPFGDTESANIRIEDNTAYLIFESKALKKQVNTLDAERAAKNMTPTPIEDLGKPETTDTSADAQTNDQGGDTGNNGGGNDADTGNNGGDNGADGNDADYDDGGEDYDGGDDYDDGGEDSSDGDEDEVSSDDGSDSGSDEGSDSGSDSGSSDSGSGDLEELDVYSSSGSESLDASDGESSDLEVSSDSGASSGEEEGSGSEDSGGDEESLPEES